MRWVKFFQEMQKKRRAINPKTNGKQSWASQAGTSKNAVPPYSRSSITKRQAINDNNPHIIAVRMSAQARTRARTRMGIKRNRASMRICLSRRVDNNAPKRPIHKTRWRTTFSVPKKVIENILRKIICPQVSTNRAITKITRNISSMRCIT